VRAGARVLVHVPDDERFICHPNDVRICPPGCEHPSLFENRRCARQGGWIELVSIIGISSQEGIYLLIWRRRGPDLLWLGLRGNSRSRGRMLTIYNLRKWHGCPLLLRGLLVLRLLIMSRIRRFLDRIRCDIQWMKRVTGSLLWRRKRDRQGRIFRPRRYHRTLSGHYHRITAARSSRLQCVILNGVVIRRIRVKICNMSGLDRRFGHHWRRSHRGRHSGASWIEGKLRLDQWRGVRG